MSLFLNLFILMLFNLWIQVITKILSILRLISEFEFDVITNHYDNSILIETNLIILNNKNQTEYVKNLYDKSINVLNLFTSNLKEHYTIAKVSRYIYK